MLGKLGEPYGGYPEPLRTNIIRGQQPIHGRPGAAMPPLDFAALEEDLKRKHGVVRDVDVMSAALYPKVYDEYREYRTRFSDVSQVPTRYFLAAPAVGEELNVEIERGKTLVVKLTAVGALDGEGHREVFFELNGQPRSSRVRDRAADAPKAEREKAVATDPGSVGAPMPGSVIELRIATGRGVSPGTPLVVLSAMKMETVVSAPVGGVVRRIAVAVGDTLAAGDLLVEIAAAQQDRAVDLNPSRW
jgi:pyruvate carboxylase